MHNKLGNLAKNYAIYFGGTILNDDDTLDSFFESEDEIKLYFMKNIHKNSI